MWSKTIRLIVDSRQSEQLTAYADVHSHSVLTHGAGQVTLDVRNNPDEAGAVLRLLHDRVVGAVAVDGVLHLSFAGGAEITALPDEQYGAHLSRRSRAAGLSENGHHAPAMASS